MSKSDELLALLNKVEQEYKSFPGIVESKLSNLKSSILGNKDLMIEYIETFLESSDDNVKVVKSSIKKPLSSMSVSELTNIYRKIESLI